MSDLRLSASQFGAMKKRSTSGDALILAERCLRLSGRNLDALLTSLVNIDRHSLIAILTAEAEAAQRSVKAARQRTAAQRSKRRQTADHLARIERILCFFERRNRTGDVGRRHRTL